MRQQDPYKEMYRYEDTLEQEIGFKAKVAEHNNPAINSFVSTDIESTTVTSKKRGKMTFTKFAALLTTVAVTATAAVSLNEGVQVTNTEFEYYYDSVTSTFTVSEYDEQYTQQGFIVKVEGVDEDIRYCTAYHEYNESEEQIEPTPDFSQWYWWLDGLTPGATYSYELYHLLTSPFASLIDEYAADTEYTAALEREDCRKVYASSFTVPPNYTLNFNYSFQPNLLYDGSFNLNYNCILFAPNGSEVTSLEPADIEVELYVMGDEYNTFTLPPYSTSGSFTISGAVNSIYVTLHIGDEYYDVYMNYQVDDTYTQPEPSATISLDYDEEQTSVTATASISNIDFTLPTPTHILVLQVTESALDGDILYTNVYGVQLLSGHTLSMSVVDLSANVTYNYAVYATAYTSQLHDELQNLDALYSYDFSSWSKIGALDDQTIQQNFGE